MKLVIKTALNEVLELKHTITSIKNSKKTLLENRQ